MFSSCFHTVAQTVQRLNLLKMSFYQCCEYRYECCLIVSNTAAILFVSVPLGSNGDTQQPVKSMEPSHVLDLKTDPCAYSTVS